MLFGLLLLASGCAVMLPESSGPSSAEPPGSNPAGRDSGTGASSVAAAPIAVVLNDPDLRHLEVLQVFSARLGRPYQIFNLAHRSAESVLRDLKARAPLEVVALGPAAFSLTKAVPGLEVFYAGVLNPGAASQGVDALPPFGAQLDYWLSLAPKIQRIGVIGGPAMQARVSGLAAAAAERDLVLEQRLVRSDTETVLAFRAMVPRIDGFVFLPDENVLSPRVIQQVMNHGRQNAVQILVYSPVMFNLGASLYLQPDPVGVASALVDLLEDPGARPEVTRMRSRSRLSGGSELSAMELSAIESPVLQRGFQSAR